MALEVRINGGTGPHPRPAPDPPQEARRDLDFFINRHEHDPLQKFVLSKKQLVNVKKEPKQIGKSWGGATQAPGPHPKP